MPQPIDSVEVAFDQELFSASVKHALRWPRAAAQELQHMFKDLARPIYEDATVLVQGEWHTSGKQRLEERGARECLWCDVEVSTANVQSDHSSALITIAPALCEWRGVIGRALHPFCLRPH